MIVEALARLAAVLRPDALGVEALIAAAVVAVVLAVAAALRVLRVPDGGAPRVDGAASARVRVLLRASDPDAAGHRRARAPGLTG